MIFARFVVGRGSTLGGLLNEIDIDRAIVHAGGGEFEGVHGESGIAIGEVDQQLERIWRDVDIATTKSALGIRQCDPQNLLDIGIGQRLQHDDPRTGEQRRVHLERWVFRCGSDQDDGAVLDVRQDGILLGFVEAMNLIDEKDGPLALHAEPVAGFLDRRSQIGHAGRHRADRNE